MSFKICIIGCGEMARIGHGPSLRKYAGIREGIELAACCDLDEAKAAAFQKDFGFRKYYRDMDMMLDNEEPDAVSLVVPEFLTAPLSIKILKKGYPLILEKPPGVCREEALRMIEAAEKYRVPHQVAFNRRYIPLVRALKSRVDEDFKPSDIQNIRYDFYRVGRTEQHFEATAIHGIDAVAFLAGARYKHIRFHYQEFTHLGPKVANIFMDCVMESGAAAQLNFCPVSGAVIERAAVNIYNHSFFLDIPVWGAMDSPGRLLHIDRKEVKLDATGSDISDGEELFETNGFYGENAVFLDDIRAGRKPHGDIRSCLQSVEVAECIARRQTEYISNE